MVRVKPIHPSYNDGVYDIVRSFQYHSADELLLKFKLVYSSHSTSLVVQLVALLRWFADFFFFES